MEREFVLQTTASSLEDTTYSLIVWESPFDGADMNIKAAIHGMTI